MLSERDTEPGENLSGKWAKMSMTRKDFDKTGMGLVAIILGVVGLGWLGVHKFVMGRKKQAIISIVVSVVTCGIGAGIMTIISLVEGIIYLTKTDAEFQNDYVYGSKEWF